MTKEKTCDCENGFVEVINFQEGGRKYDVPCQKCVDGESAHCEFVEAVDNKEKVN